MNIAFYAPMKPPDFPIPSGDRRVARSIIDALGAAGHAVELASRFGSRDASGDPDRQARLRDLGGRLAERLIRRYRGRPAGERPQLWFSYHVYYKAPDWIGPAVCDGLGIPYVIAEASFAPKRAGGAWDLGHRAAADAIGRADAIFGLNQVNKACVLPLLDDAERWIPMPPFIDCGPYRTADAEPCRRRLAQHHDLDPAVPWLLVTAMMRDDVKLESYRLLGRALSEIAGRQWRLLVVGDGPARAEVEDGLPAGRAVFLGEKSTEELAQIYPAADLFVWPAINEAYGMAILEAQAAGVPIVAGNSGGVAEIVRDGETGVLVTAGDTAAFAAAVGRLLDDRGLRRTMSLRAKENTQARHGLTGAADRLNRVLTGLVQ